MKNKEVQNAIDYLKGWCYEGENITITCDFIENVEIILDYINKINERNDK